LTLLLLAWQLKRGGRRQLRAAAVGAGPLYLFTGTKGLALALLFCRTPFPVRVPSRAVRAVTEMAVTPVGAGSVPGQRAAAGGGCQPGAGTGCGRGRARSRA